MGKFHVILIDVKDICVLVRGIVFISKRNSSQINNIELLMRERHHEV